MAIYKLRVFLEDDENIYRDIEVKQNQSFSLLQPVINEAFGQKKNKDAIFYKSDESWKKVKKISDPVTTSIVDIVEHPHQKMIYEIPHSFFGDFYIELIDIKPNGKPKTKYPHCIKSSGLLPGQISEDSEEFNAEIIIDENEVEDEFEDYDIVDDTPDNFQ